MQPHEIWEIVWMIFGRIAKKYIFDYCRYDGFIGIILITGAMMASWATVWLLAVWCRHGQRVNYLCYEGLMGSGLIAWAIMASWVASWLLALEWLRWWWFDYTIVQRHFYLTFKLMTKFCGCLILQIWKEELENTKMVIIIRILKKNR